MQGGMAFDQQPMGGCAIGCKCPSVSTHRSHETTFFPLGAGRKKERERGRKDLDRKEWMEGGSVIILARRANHAA